MNSKNILRVPRKIEDFSVEWVESVAKTYLSRLHEDIEDIKILSAEARENNLQGLLSITFIVDISYSHNGDQVSRRSIFVKVPIDDLSYKSSNDREYLMFTELLPELIRFLDDNCGDGLLRLPIPEIVYCYYDGRGRNDVFVLESLLDSGFKCFEESLHLNETHLEACLECLSQLHGTGLAYKFKKNPDSCSFFGTPLSKLDEQIQLKDLLRNDRLRDEFKRNYKPFLYFLETIDPNIKHHTNYMKQFSKSILKVLQILEESGYEKLLTLCHGDAKPDNFMFRRHSIDIEGLECEGLEAILVDWQNGFLGSVANDLMWVTYPFIEYLNDPSLKARAFEHYFNQLKSVLETFNLFPDDFGLPDNFPEFYSILNKALVLEFLLVTVVKPVVSLKDAYDLRKWYKRSMKNVRTGHFDRKIRSPNPADIFSSPRFPGFCRLYFQIATSVGGFQELSKIFLEVAKDDDNDEFSEEEEEEEEEEEKGQDGDDEEEEEEVDGVHKNVTESSLNYFIPISASLMVLAGILWTFSF